MPAPFTAGEVISRREVLHGELWLSAPVTVVSDDGDVLATRCDPGAPFHFPEHPFGDLIVWPDGRREWKDVEDLHHQVAEGRISPATVSEVLATAAGLVELLDEDRRWWSDWDDWTP